MLALLALALSSAIAMENLDTCPSAIIDVPKIEHSGQDRRTLVECIISINEDQMPVLAHFGHAPQNGYNKASSVGYSCADETFSFFIFRLLPKHQQIEPQHFSILASRSTIDITIPSESPHDSDHPTL
ncbi:hypothetical protein BD410DRAFT_501148 [Rickenella mellea]|uniref:Uncharacterized protein n=1 Tax=Rickenella mellea TaxID=50990 RepID=A0A4Y7PSN4_9AGAM|nr:hypothetical protein BD410DRAFT_501148 [Rickenella mellea]